MTIADCLWQLRTMGVASVDFRFDGSGDSGEIEEMTFTLEADEAGALSRLGGWVPSLKMEVFLQDEAYQHLPSGWEINAGSSGTITLYVDSGEWGTDINWRTDESEDDLFDDDVSYEDEREVAGEDNAAKP